jgi:hypothetical protein
MSNSEIIQRLLKGDPSLFEGSTAQHSLGWLRHPEMYLGDWLDDIAQKLPRRHEKTILLGIGGSAGPGLFFAEAIQSTNLQVLDTSNPDSIAGVSFTNSTVIAASKSGVTVETLSLISYALANGLLAQDLVLITDPDTLLSTLGKELGCLVIEGDVHTGGRFSALSPFGLVPALYAGWTPEQLRSELSGAYVNEQVVAHAFEEAAIHAADVNFGHGYFALTADPVTSGGAMWLEQLIAETTGKSDRGFIPVFTTESKKYAPSQIQHFHLVASLLAWHLGVDPFNQPNVDAAKSSVLSLLENEVAWTQQPFDVEEFQHDFRAATYRTLQVYGPLSIANDLSSLQSLIQNEYGTTTANFGPRYLHSTGQLHKGGPKNVAALQIVLRPYSDPVLIPGSTPESSFQDLHMAQATSDFMAMRDSGRHVWQLIVNDLSEVAQLVGL